MNDISSKKPSVLKSLMRHLHKRTEGEAIIKARYRQFYDQDLNTTSPERFSEKLYCRMLLAHRGNYKVFTPLADKFLARDYVASKIGIHHLTRLLWSGKDPRHIPFPDLPDEYIIKTNHGCGTNIVVRRNADRSAIISKLSDWLAANYYWDDREHHYYGIEPRILIEELLHDGREDGPLDYRFWCFDGQPEVINIDNHCHSIGPYYDINWNKLSLSSRKHFTEVNIEKPENFENMLVLASKLSSDFDFVRVDLYNLHGKIYFGELTFTPGAGRFSFEPDDWDVKLGSKWNFRIY